MRGKLHVLEKFVSLGTCLVILAFIQYVRRLYQWEPDGREPHHYNTLLIVKRSNVFGARRALFGQETVVYAFEIWGFLVLLKITSSKRRKAELRETKSHLPEKLGGLYPIKSARRSAVSS